jgi:hypothetical protein
MLLRVGRSPSAHSAECIKVRPEASLIKSSLTFFTVLIACLTFAGAANAQRAAVSGSVSDQSGGDVPGVRITLLNVDQGLKRETVTNESGYFTVPLLQPGRYVITAQKDGFAVSEITDVVLHVGDTRGIEVRLQLSAAPVEIQVSANTQAVETVSTALGQVVTSEVVRNAPLNGRDIRDLALLQPGVTPVDQDYRGPGTFNINGNRADSVGYLLDGGLNNDLIDNRAVFVPNPDTVAEFRILTSNYPAEYGRNSGGVITVATQSGTNHFHGTAFDFLRNNVLNANSYFNKQAGLPRNDYKRNQFGGTLGGPLTIPHVMNGRDRYFFFVGYQGERIAEDLTQHNIETFTPQELGGDFSHSGPNGGPDPSVAAFLQANPFFQSNAAMAQQAIIDPMKINTVAQNYISAKLIPTSPTGLLNSQEPFSSDRDELTTKFDFDLNARNKLAFTLGGDRTHQITPFDYANVPGFPHFSDFHDYFLNIAYTHIFSATLLNELKVTAVRSSNNAENPARDLPKPADLGIGITPDLPTGPTNLAWDTGLSIGFSIIGPQHIEDNTFSYSDTLTWIRGKHAFKFGGGLSAYQNNTFVAFVDNGQFVFIGQNGEFSGNSFADFLLGLPLEYIQNSAAPSNIRSKFIYGFAEDEWRIRKNLVLSLGLRYEYSTPKSDTLGRTFSVIPGEHSLKFPNAPPGMVFPGDPGAPRGVNYADRNDWAPRVGFAWDPRGNGKTSLRGAFGVFYDILKAEDNLQFNGKPPFFASAGFGFAPLAGNPTTEVNYLTQPFVAAGVPNPFPSRPPQQNLDFAAAGYLPIGSSGSIFIVDPHLRTPYTYQYHLTFQREVAENTVFQASYVGSASRKLTALTDVNPFVLGTFDRVLNLTPASSPCGATDPFLCYASLHEFRNTSSASYNSLLASLQKQFSGTGIFGRSYFTLAYTYAHNIDNASGFENRNVSVPYYQPNLFRASSDMDVRNRIVFSGGWELPFEKAWQNGPKRLTQGWNVFPIVTWHSGLPLDIFANLPSAFDFNSPGPSAAGDAGLVRANLVGPIQIFDPRTQRTIAGDTGNFWFNPTSFTNTNFPTDAQAVALPEVRTYGSLARNTLRGPGNYNIDMAFSKTTPIHENLRLEVRADFFNLVNHAQFANPDTNISSPTFGRFLYTFQPRIIQLALRVSF